MQRSGAAPDIAATSSAQVITIDLQAHTHMGGRIDTMVGGGTGQGFKHEYRSASMQQAKWLQRTLIDGHAPLEVVGPHTSHFDTKVGNSAVAMQDIKCIDVWYSEPDRFSIT